MEYRLEEILIDFSGIGPLAGAAEIIKKLVLRTCVQAANIEFQYRSNASIFCRWCFPTLAPYINLSRFLLASIMVSNIQYKSYNCIEHGNKYIRIKRRRQKKKRLFKVGREVAKLSREHSEKD